ncbi:MAG: hypothetical protein AB7E81_04440 [Hyphomicrobiaceae bacterium]
MRTDVVVAANNQELKRMALSLALFLADLEDDLEAWTSCDDVAERKYLQETAAAVLASVSGYEELLHDMMHEGGLHGPDLACVQSLIGMIAEARRVGGSMIPN